ncbi:MAG: hypothetical protein ACR2MN_14960 [Acidimicrobiales bacterium]
MSLEDNTSPTGRALQAVSAAGIDLPEEATTAMAVTTTIRNAQNEELPDPPARPGWLVDCAVAVADYAEALHAHATETSMVNTRRQAAAALQPVADAQLAGAVSAAAPGLIAATVDAFNAKWAMFTDNPDLARAWQVNRLYTARLALGALAGEAHNPLNMAAIVFAIESPQPGQGRPIIDVLHHWATVNQGPSQRWQDSLPALRVAMVDPAGVAPRLAALQAWTATAPLARPSARAGARYDRPLPLGAEPEAASA